MKHFYASVKIFHASVEAFYVSVKMFHVSVKIFHEVVNVLNTAVKTLSGTIKVTCCTSFGLRQCGDLFLASYPTFQLAERKSSAFPKFLEKYRGCAALSRLSLGGNGETRRKGTTLLLGAKNAAVRLSVGVVIYRGRIAGQ